MGHEKEDGLQVIFASLGGDMKGIYSKWHFDNQMGHEREHWHFQVTLFILGDNINGNSTLIIE